MERKINYQFKILYAIAMILVVTGHCFGGGVSFLYDFFPPYSFHIGLFVFCSGYFYKEVNEQDICAYVYKKVKRFIFPLYMYNFIYMLIAQLLALYGFQFGRGVNWDKLIISPITSGHQYVYNLSTWFVVPLFMTQVFNVVFRRLLCIIKHQNIKENFYIFTSLGLGMTGIYLSSIGLNTGIWLVLDRLLYFIPFYSLGYTYKKRLEYRDHLSNDWYFLLIFSLSLLIIYLNNGPLEYEQAWCKFPKFNLYPFIVGFLGIAFWLRISKILVPILKNSHGINLIADNTFSIMANHIFVFFLVKCFFAIGYVYTTFLFQDFNWYAFQNNIWYYYLPKQLPQFLIVYVFFGIFIGIKIQTTINKVKQKIFKTLKNKKLYEEVIYLLYIITILLCLVLGYSLNSVNEAQLPI